MMKVALLSYLFDRHSGGGAPRSAFFLAQGLRDLGIDVVVITTHDGPDDFVDDDGFRVYRLAPRNWYWVGRQHTKAALTRVGWQLLDIWNPLVYRAVVKILREEEPDVVHVQKLRGLSPSVWAAARTAGVTSIVQTCRDYELVSPDAMLRGAVGQLAKSRSILLFPYERVRAKMSKTVRAAIAPSRFTLDFHTERGFFPSAELKVIHNTPGYTLRDLGRIRRIPRAYSSHVRILYIGRLERIKGVADLCEAVESLTPEYPHVRLDVVGDGAEAERLRSRFGNCPCIVFHGLVHGARKEELLTHCSVLVIPSRWPEVFGNVVPEAFSFGKPVIGARAGGIPELIDEGRTGFLFESGHVRMLRSVLERFIIDPNLSPSMRKRCYRAAEGFTIDAVASAHSALYEYLVELEQPQ